MPSNAMPTCSGCSPGSTAGPRRPAASHGSGIATNRARCVTCSRPGPAQTSRWRAWRHAPGPRSAEVKGSAASRSRTSASASRCRRRPRMDSCEACSRRSGRPSSGSTACGRRSRRCSASTSARNWCVGTSSGSRMRSRPRASPGSSASRWTGSRQASLPHAAPCSCTRAAPSMPMRPRTRSAQGLPRGFMVRPDRPSRWSRWPEPPTARAWCWTKPCQAPRTAAKSGRRSGCSPRTTAQASASTPGSAPPTPSCAGWECTAASPRSCSCAATRRAARTTRMRHRSTAARAAGTAVRRTPASPARS